MSDPERKERGIDIDPATVLGIITVLLLVPLLLTGLLSH